MNKFINAQKITKATISHGAVNPAFFNHSAPLIESRELILETLNKAINKVIVNKNDIGSKVR